MCVSTEKMNTTQFMDWILKYSSNALSRMPSIQTKGMSSSDRFHRKECFRTIQNIRAYLGIPIVPNYASVRFALTYPVP